MKNIKNKRIRKSLLMLDIKILMVSLNVFGQYFKISSSKITSVFLRIYCICTAIFSFYNTIFYLCLQSNDRIVAFNSLLTIEHQFWFFTSQITSQVYLSTYTQTILTCDSLMGYKKKVFEINNLYILMIISICLSLYSLLFDVLFTPFWINILLNDTKNGIFLLLNHYYMEFSIDLAPYTIMLVVGMLQHRLMLLRQTLERNTVPVNIVGKDETQPKLRVVRKCFINYNNLLDAFDAVDLQMQFKMTAALMFNIPLTVLCGYVLMKEWLFDDLKFSAVYVNFIRISLTIIAPCALTEMCYNEVDKLKALLIMQIIKCSDAELRMELNRALDYVTERPFNFTLLRAVRVDIQLTLTIFALVITYIILIIQFTHFKL